MGIHGGLFINTMNIQYNIHSILNNYSEILDKMLKMQ